MNRVQNPYSPGAGAPPPALVGRQQPLEDMDVALERRLIGRSAKGIMLTGRRGVGKTVLLAEFAARALRFGYVHEHIEAGDGVDFAREVASAVRRVLLQLQARQRRPMARAARAQVRRALGVLKAFSVRLPQGPEFTLEVAPVPGPADSGDLAIDLAGLLRETGEAARALSAGVLLTLDELQYLAPSDLSALIVGLHRVEQAALPVQVAGAGLPSLPGLLGEVRSYVERMFTFVDIGALSAPDIAEALSRPARDAGVHWTDEAIVRVAETSEGYPYFLQEFGKTSWDVAPGPSHIGLSDVTQGIPLAEAELDGSFFRVRFDRTTDGERAYLRAMAHLGPGPHATAEVAKAMRRTVQQVGSVRDSLIRRGLLFAPRWGLIDFTVPMFDRFLRRALH